MTLWEGLADGNVSVPWEKCSTVINELCPGFTPQLISKRPWHLLNDSSYTSLLLHLKHFNINNKRLIWK